MKEKEEYVSLRKLAADIGETYSRVWYHRMCGRLPHGTVRLGERCFYTAAQATQVERYFDELAKVRR